MSNTAIIMAGGRGLRLEHLTDHSPKPMVPIGTKPMLQEIIERFSRQGIKKFIITVNYLSELITDYFGDGSEFGVSINYIHEREPLGTAGSLRMVRNPKKPKIVMNADILVDADFNDILRSHNESRATATVCLAEWKEQIKYGVAILEGTKFLAVDEKPVNTYPVFSGIYVLSPAAFEEIPRAGPYHMTDLITKLAKKSGSVNTYAIKNHWQDIGTLDDYRRING